MFLKEYFELSTLEIFLFHKRINSSQYKLYYINCLILLKVTHFLHHADLWCSIRKELSRIIVLWNGWIDRSGRSVSGAEGECCLRQDDRQFYTPWRTVLVETKRRKGRYFEATRTKYGQIDVIPGAGHPGAQSLIRWWGRSTEVT